MKIGTDGVLLGAWVSLKEHPFSILDIGAGTGVIALQMAQRSDAEIIDALEVDSSAHEQCVENFENSNWADRLFCYHASLQEFAEEVDDKYDLIISNPPFYSDNYKPENIARDVARFNHALPFEVLLQHVSYLLSEVGIFAVILPKKEEMNFLELAEGFHLYPKRICRVKGTPTSEEKRSLIELTFKKGLPAVENLIVENSRHDYTEDYRGLVQDFYLKM